MSSNLHWNTVSALLKESLEKLMTVNELKDFRLVGGTSLSLQLGHRMSEDIDLFTGSIYGSIDFDAIDARLHSMFPYVSTTPGKAALGRPYFMGESEADGVKLDLYYTEQFIQEPLDIDGIRLATIEDVIAMKVNIIQRGGRKKDFWDLHTLLDEYSIDRMIILHEQRFPFDHDAELIRTNFLNFTNADDDFEPRCLFGKHWELIKLDFLSASR